MSPDGISEEDVAEDQPPKQGDKSSRPTLTPRAATGKAERAGRVAAEMRKNLLKRKQQQRDKQQRDKQQRDKQQRDKQQRDKQNDG